MDIGYIANFRTLKQQDDVEKLQKQRHGNGSAVTAVEAELSPRTRRRLLEQSLRKEDDLHESTSVLPPSTPPQLAPTSDVIDSVAVAASSTESKSGTIIPPKSPKLSLKSKSSKPFEWGKSKFSTVNIVYKARLLNLFLSRNMKFSNAVKRSK
jgi:hypothetical protein